MASKKFKLVGWSISMSLLSLVSLVVFILALKALLWKTFSQHALIICIVSGILLVIFILTGTLQIRAIVKKGKGMFG